MKNNHIEPHAKKKICGARCRTRNYEPCRSSPMANGRCRMHGGPSTGPKTPEGRERSRMANWKNGLRSKGFMEEKRKVLSFIKSMKEQREKFL